MSSTPAPVPTPVATSTNVRLRIAQAILVAPLGVLVAFASVYFSVVAPPVPVDGLGALVATWALTMGVASMIVGVRLRPDRANLIQAARALAVAHLLFGVVKLAVYGESASISFMLLDLTLLGVLPRRRALIARAEPEVA